MKSIPSVSCLPLLLAVAALPLGACAAPPLDDGGAIEADHEDVGEAEEAMTTYRAETQISGQQSQDAPAVAAYDGTTYMVHRGQSSNNLYSSTCTLYGDCWTPNQQIAGLSAKATVGLTAHQNKLHMAYLSGSTNNIHYSSYQAGGSWSQDVTLSYQSKKPPALASDPITQNLMLVYVDTPYQVLQYTLYDGDWHSSYVVPGTYPGGNGSTTKAPALAVHQGRVHLVYENMTGALMHTSFDGHTWVTPNTVGSKYEQSSPALTSWFGKLYLFHRGETDNNIWWSSSFDGLAWTSDVTVPAALTRDSPSVAPLGSTPLLLAHSGNSSSNLWYQIFVP